jgi:hypothetical protein
MVCVGTTSFCKSGLTLLNQINHAAFFDNSGRAFGSHDDGLFLSNMSADAQKVD